MVQQDTTAQENTSPTIENEASAQAQPSTDTVAATTPPAPQPAATAQPLQTPPPPKATSSNINYESIIYIGPKPEKQFTSPLLPDTEEKDSIDHITPYLGKICIAEEKQTNEPAIETKEEMATEEGTKTLAEQQRFPYLKKNTEKTFLSPLKFEEAPLVYKDYTSFDTLAAIFESLDTITTSSFPVPIPPHITFSDSAITRTTPEQALQEPPAMGDFEETLYTQVQAPLQNKKIEKTIWYYDFYEEEKPEIPEEFDIFWQAPAPKETETSIAEVAEEPENETVFEETDPRILAGEELPPVAKQQEEFKTPNSYQEPKEKTLSTEDFSVILTLPADTTKKKAEAIHKVDQNTREETEVAHTTSQTQQPSDPFESADWMLFYVCGTLAIWGYLRLLYKKYLSGTIRSALSFALNNRLLRQRNDLAARVSFFLKTIFYANLGLFIYQSIKIKSPDLLTVDGLWGALLIAGCCAVLYLGKTILLYTLGFITGATNLVAEYLHTVSTYNKVTGLLLFPVIFSIPYMTKSSFIGHTELMYAGISLLGFTYFVRIVRGAIITLQQNISPFYIILYLCMIEILPIMIVIKAIFY